MLKQLSSRRNFVFKASAAALGTSVVVKEIQTQVFAPSKAEAASVKDITPDQALKSLVDGNQRFVKYKLTHPRQTAARLQEVAKGQTPFAAILGCADSRVPAEIVFDQGLGDLFVCRVAGNIATPEEIGSLEFGCAVLGTKVIMVLGHERCGAVDATIKGAAVPGQIGSLLAAIKPSVSKAAGQSGDQLENTCKANVLAQVETLKTSPVLAQLVKDKKLKIVGGYYDLDLGSVVLL